MCTHAHAGTFKTQTGLHRDACTQRRFYTQRNLTALEIARIGLQMVKKRFYIGLQMVKDVVTDMFLPHRHFLQIELSTHSRFYTDISTQKMIVSHRSTFTYTSF